MDDGLFTWKYICQWSYRKNSFQKSWLSKDSQVAKSHGIFKLMDKLNLYWLYFHIKSVSRLKY